MSLNVVKLHQMTHLRIRAICEVDVLTRDPINIIDINTNIETATMLSYWQ